MSPSALRHPEAIPRSAPVDLETLAFLRFHWARCRCLARQDFHSARPDHARAPEARAVALFRALTCPDALGGLRLFQLGATELSFDEKWLLAALTACARQDTDSLTFLLTRRLQKPARRQVGVLIMALSRSLGRSGRK